MTDPIYSICIVTYRARDFLRDCLNSIYQSPPEKPFEIIVVDNRSEDGTVEMLQADYPQVRYVVEEKNEGYTRPMNRALQMATGRYLIQLNPDTLVYPGTFDCLDRFMEEHPRVGIVTPKVLNRNGTMQKQCRRSAARPWDTITYFSGLSRLFPKNRRFAGYLMTYMPEDEPCEVEAVSGCFMMIRREVVDQIGYLDNLFFAFQEDSDYCFRAREDGWQVYYVPAAQIVHYGGEGGAKVEVYRSIYQWHRSYFNYYRKHMARDYFFLLNWVMYTLMAFKLGVALFSALLRREKFAGTRKPK